VVSFNCRQESVLVVATHATLQWRKDIGNSCMKIYCTGKISSKEISMLWFIFHKPQDVVVYRQEESRQFFYKLPAITFLQRIYKNSAYFRNNETIGDIRNLLLKICR
jgi:hypothetical protein